MAVGFAIALTAYYEGLVRLHADRLLRSPPRLGPTSGIHGRSASSLAMI